MAEGKSGRVIISLGGSLIVPEGGIDWRFLKRFKELIEGEVALGRSFILVTGGGQIARQYISAAGNIASVSDEDRDWLGIHSTRLNAHLVRTIFRDHAYPRINTNPHDLDDFYLAKEPILVAAGWRPGHSTDYDAVLLGKYLDATDIINLSNIEYVYDADPRDNPSAKKLESLSWAEFRTIVGEEWSPGLNTPFDPVAARLAEHEKMRVAILSGADLDNVKSYLDGKPFHGTVIR